jgi:hypothetical protein
VSIATFIPEAKAETKVNTDISPASGLWLAPLMAGDNETSPTASGPISAYIKKEITDLVSRKLSTISLRAMTRD